MKFPKHYKSQEGKYGSIEKTDKANKFETIYGNNPDIAAVYSIGKSTKEVVVIKDKGKHYLIYADIAGVRREKDITHVGEAMEWLKDVLTKMSDVISDKEIDESTVKSRLTFQYGKDLLGVEQSAELKQGIKVEKEHADTIKKIASGEIKPEDAPAAIAEDHLKESKTYYKDLEKVENKGREKKYDLGFGSLGNGTTVYNRAKMVNGDYPRIAHISNEGIVNYYGKEYPESVKKEIEAFANNQKTPVTESSDKVKSEPSTKDFEGSQQSGTGKLYEYFTPMDVVEKMWALAYHYGKNVLPGYGMKVLDPAMGSGRLFTYAPKNALVTGFEINKENERIAMDYCISRNFASIRLYNESFEIAFLNPPRYNSKLKGKKTTWLDDYPFDLVIANPPYGKFTGLYKTHFDFTGQFEHFFIEYSMKLVKKDGLGVFLVPSSFLRNGNTYNSVKERIFSECKLLDAYRLPANIFKHTQIGTDIIVLQKK